MNKNYSIVIALMMFFNLSLFSQDGPPWDFNGTDHGFVASNYTALAVGDTYLTYSINSPNDDGNGGSANPNFKKENAMLDTSPGNFIAVTLQNLTANTRIVVILTKNGNNTYTNFDGLTPNNEGFVTHYINVGGSANWNGEVDAINFRFKQGGGVNNNVYAGDILFDHIEVVDGIPSTPRMDYTFDDPSDAEGFVGGNGVSLSQPNAGSIVANISANSPYPKFEQSGIYSVDADTYKYVEINLTNNSPKNRITFVSPNGGNQFSGSEMAQGEQLIYLNLSEMTNWNGAYSNWWLQLVENPGDGPVASAGEVIIDRILFTDVNNAPMPFHDVTFNVDARNMIVHDKGIYMGGGVLGGADAVAMSDEDGDGIWSVTLNLQEGTTGNWAFFNSPGDGGDWGTKEYLDGQACADAENFNDRVVPAFDADNLEFNFCFAVCNDTNSFCAETVERANVTFTVGTADIEVGPNGMYVGGGAFGGSNGHAMADNGDDTHSVTISVPVGTVGHYAFINSPDNHYDWGKKEGLENAECADGDNYWDRPLAEVTADVAYSYCFASCETECAVPNNGIAEFPACFDFEGENALDGWQIVPLDGTAGDPTWQVYSNFPTPDDANSILGHSWGAQGVELIDFAISPQFNTSGMSDAQLSFDEYVIDGSYGTAHRVWVSTDEVLSFTSENLSIIYDNIYTPDGEFNSVVLDLPEAEYVTVIFQYEGTWGSFWGVDNMCVEETPAEPNFVTADPNNAWGGYMEVFDLDGNFQFGNPWDVADLQTVLQPDVPNMILYPNFNTYNAEDPYWSNGEMGNKIMRATTQVESWDMYNGADLTFTGSVAEHTLEGYDTVYFIKCLDPDAGWSDMLEAAYVLPLPESGEFSVTVSGDLLPAGKLVQFGFSVVGLNANPAFDYGKVVIGDVGLSIGENNSLDMVIYPNPVDGDYVTIQTPLNGDKLVEVFDVNGRKVMERLLTTNTLNVSSISAGMYIVKVTVEDQSNVSKLIIE
jgi:hypothetical protein